MDYAKNQKYFEKLKIGMLIKGIILFVAGLFTTMWGLVDYEDEVTLVGIILLIVGIALFIITIIIFVKKTMSDAEYDNSIKNAISAIKKDALENLNIDEAEVSEVNPIEFGCFNFDTFDKIKVGKDNKLRTDRYISVVVYPTQNELNVYEYEFSTTKELKKKKGTIYFYKDIVSIEVSTITRSISDMGNKKLSLKNFLSESSVTYEKLQVVTKGGSTLSINLIGEDEGIKSLRTLLKENKRA